MKLPHHACYHLETQAGLRLIDVEAVRKTDALVGNFDVKMSVDFSSVNLDNSTTFWVGIFDRVCNEFVNQKTQGNGVVRRKQQTAVINAIRAHLAEFGIVAPVGRHGVEELLTVVADPNDKRVPEIARACLLAVGAQLRRIKEQILEFGRLIRAWHRSNEMSMRLEAAPGVGPVLATALVAAVADPKSFRSGRNFSAWIGMVPKQHSSGGQQRLGNISKQGDRYLRDLFVAGALSVIRYAKIHGTKHRPWLTALLARRPTKVAAIALANKIARMVWAMMARGERYKEPVALAQK